MAKKKKKILRLKEGQIAQTCNMCRQLFAARGRFNRRCLKCDHLVSRMSAQELRAPTMVVSIDPKRGSDEYN